MAGSIRAGGCVDSGTYRPRRWDGEDLCPVIHTDVSGSSSLVGVSAGTKDEPTAAACCGREGSRMRTAGGGEDQQVGVHAHVTAARYARRRMAGWGGVDAV